MKYVIYALFFVLTNTIAAQNIGIGKNLSRFAYPDKMVKVKQVVQSSRTDINTDLNHLRKVSGVSAFPSEVKPLLGNVNLWHQYYAPYNNLTPVIDGVHCPTGCVALAMSQVMHYYRFPERGTGSYQYIDSTGCKQTLSCDFSSHRYDWDNMLYEYEHTEYNETQANAVALLQSDCGISVNMRYGKGASGAYTVRQPISLVRYFGYDKGAQIYYRDFYSRDEITSMLKNELANGRPVLISGSNQYGSHAFLIDGYNDDNEFHIMLGNPDGQGDNWTKLDYMCADSEDYGIGTPENGINILMSFVMGIQPKTENSDKNEHHLFVMRDIVAINEKAGRNESLRIATNDLCNVGCNMHSDSVVLMLVNDKGNLTPIYSYSHEFLLEETEDTTYCDTIDTRIPDNIPAGSYRIIPMYRDNGGWTEVRCCVGTPNYILADIKDSGITLSSDTANTSYLTLEDIFISDYMFNASVQDFTIRLKAHNAEMCGRLYVEMEPLFKDGKSFYLQQHGISISKDEEVEYHYGAGRVWIPKHGKYRLHIYYHDNLFSDKLIELELPREFTVEFIGSSLFEIASR